MASDNGKFGSDLPPPVANGPWGSGGGSGSGGDNGGKSPWQRPGGGGGNNGGKGGGDLEEQMRRMQERFRGGRRKGGGGGKGGPTFGPMGFAVLGLVALVAWLFTGVVVVDEGERAAVFRLGKYETNFPPGLNFHFPIPIETHEIIPAEKQQETQIGGTNSESLMLTGDENIVDVQFRVFWYFDDEHPEDFILNVDHGGTNSERSLLVKAAAESVMREVVGKSQLDAVITTGRAEIQAIVKEQLSQLLADYKAGVSIQNVEIQEAQAPGPVREAFLDVINAGQDAERAVEDATKIANDIIPRARGNAQKVLQDAQAYREQVIAEATGQADRFKAIYAEYRQAPQVTRERMYLETMEKVLARADKLVLDSDSGAVPYLPLDQVRRGGN